MRDYCRAHRWLMLVALCALTAARVVMARFPDLHASSGTLMPAADGGFVAIGLPFLAWFKNVDRARLIDTVADFFTKFLNRRSSTPAPPPAQPQTIAAHVAVAPPIEDDGSGETVMVSRPTLGSITFVSGALLGRTWQIPPQGLTIGRDPTSDVILTDKHVSVKHALIRPKNGQVVVVDEQSMNGIFLNEPDNRITGEASLSPGDTVMLSPTDAARFVYRL